MIQVSHSMPIKNHVCAHQIYHIVLVNFVLLVIYQDFGASYQKNVKAVSKMHILIQLKKDVSIAQMIDHYGMEINVFHALLDQILI